MWGMADRLSSRAAAFRAGWVLALDRFAIRALDVAVSACLLLLVLPAIAAIALAIRLESPGGVFFRCRRAGQDGRPLLMLKFRKMHASASGLALTTAEDVRLNRLGKFLARTKLDEIPQLWNVLTGEMSLVGPRPEDPGFVALQQESFREILALRPGITGLAQLAFANEGWLLEATDAYNYYVEHLLPQKIQLDRLYAARQSFAFNLKILLWTAVVLIRGCSVAVNRETGRLTIRRQPLPASAPVGPLATEPEGSTAT